MEGWIATTVVTRVSCELRLPEMYTALPSPENGVGGKPLIGWLALRVLVSTSLTTRLWY